MQLVQAQGFGQSLLSEGLFREHSGDAVGAFLALGWVQQNELLNLTQLFQKLFGGDSTPGALRLFVKMLQERDARRVSSTLRHPAWEFSDYLPSSFRRMAPAC